MSAASTDKIGIPNGAIDTVFPFHFAVDDQLRVLQVGASLSRADTGFEVGTQLDDSLLLRRPHGILSVETIRSATEHTFLLELRRSGIRMRGQFLEAEAGSWLFLGSPWFESAEAIEAAGLSLRDFPIHDSMAELLMIGQTQRMAVQDLRELTERLELQRQEIRRTQRIHRDAIAAARAVAYQESFVHKRFEFMGSGIERLTGYPADEITPDVFRNMIVETLEVTEESDVIDGVQVAARRAEHRIRDRTGTERWLFEAWVPEVGANDEVEGAVGILEDITERKRQEEERERMSAELDTILRLSSQGFAAFHGDGKLSYCNPSFSTMLGLSDTEPLAIDLTALDALFRELSAPGQAPTPLLDLQDADADELMLARPGPRHVTRSLQRMGGADDNLRGWVLYMRDVTRDREIERMKSEFLSIAAHELRTPMTSVQGFAELLLSKQFDEAMTRDIIETIHRQSSLLVHIVNELLDIARIEAGKGTDFVFEPWSLNELVNDTVDAFHVPGNANGIHVSISSESLPFVNADAKKMTLALTNILSNACKYSPNGGDVMLSVVRREAHGRQEVGVSVKDSGIGMTEDELKRLFERFYRADPSGTIPGTGLGMALVKEIVDLHDGTVDVTSQKGRGTVATIWLPEINQPPRSDKGDLSSVSADADDLRPAGTIERY